MAKLDLERLSILELKDLQSKLSETLKSAEVRGRADAKKQVLEFASGLGYELYDLFDLGGRRGRGGKSREVKYRNPDNHSETYGGRGPHPRWLAEKLKAGKSLEDFKV